MGYWMAHGPWDKTTYLTKESCFHLTAYFLEPGHAFAPCAGTGSRFSIRGAGDKALRKVSTVSPGLDEFSKGGVCGKRILTTQAVCRDLMIALLRHYSCTCAENVQDRYLTNLSMVNNEGDVWTGCEEARNPKDILWAPCSFGLGQHHSDGVLDAGCWILDSVALSGIFVSLGRTDM